MVRPVVALAATVDAINEAWAMPAIVTVAAVLVLPFATRGVPSDRVAMTPRRP